MAVMAQWGGKTWEVTPQKIAVIEGFSTAYKLMAEKANDAEGRPPTKYRRLDLQPISLETLLSDVAGVDVRQEIGSWSSLVGQNAPFILGGRRFGWGNFNFTLTDVTVDDIVIDELGRIRQAKLSMNFIEEAPEEAKNKPDNRQLNAGSAVGLGPSVEDKAARKPASI